MDFKTVGAIAWTVVCLVMMMLAAVNFWFMLPDGFGWKLLPSIMFFGLAVAAFSNLRYYLRRRRQRCEPILDRDAKGMQK